jgi:hypothetical protein
MIASILLFKYFNSAKCICTNVWFISPKKWNEAPSYFGFKCTRPDLAFITFRLSKFSSRPGTKHAAVCCTQYLGISFVVPDLSVIPLLYGHSDSDFAADLNNRRSTSGFAERRPDTVEIEATFASHQTPYTATTKVPSPQLPSLPMRSPADRNILTIPYYPRCSCQRPGSPADILTKALPKELHLRHVKGLGSST